MHAGVGPGVGEDHAERQRRKTLLRLVMWAVLLWGSILALGVGLFGMDPRTRDVRFSPNLPRGLVTFSCVIAFYMFWRWVLRRSGRT